MLSNVIHKYALPEYYNINFLWIYNLLYHWLWVVNLYTLLLFPRRKRRKHPLFKRKKNHDFYKSGYEVNIRAYICGIFCDRCEIHRNHSQSCNIRFTVFVNECCAFRSAEEKLRKREPFNSYWAYTKYFVNRYLYFFVILFARKMYGKQQSLNNYYIIESLKEKKEKRKKKYKN